MKFILFMLLVSVQFKSVLFELTGRFRITYLIYSKANFFIKIYKSFKIKVVQKKKNKRSSVQPSIESSANATSFFCKNDESFGIENLSNLYYFNSVFFSLIYFPIFFSSLVWKQPNHLISFQFYHKFIFFLKELLLNLIF